VTFGHLITRVATRPIPGCPGRFIVVDACRDRQPPDAAFGISDVRAYTVPTARDRVLVAALADGGVISYARSDGTYLHTLGTLDGFTRKLIALGIADADAGQP